MKKKAPKKKVVIGYDDGGEVSQEGVDKAGALLVSLTNTAAGLSKSDSTATVLRDTGSMTAAGASLGTMIAPGVGTLIGAGIGAEVGLTTSYFKNKARKKEERKNRDKKRDEVWDMVSQLKRETTDEFSTKESKYNNATVGYDSVSGMPGGNFKFLAEGGEVKGAGTAKSDSIKTKVPDKSVIVPAENEGLAQALREMFLPKKEGTMKPGGDVNVKLSNGEHMFTPKEKAVVDKSLIAQGIEPMQIWDHLIPNPDAGNELKDGTKKVTADTTGTGAVVKTTETLVPLFSNSQQKDIDEARKVLTEQRKHLPRSQKPRVMANGGEAKNIDKEWEEFIKQAKADFKKMPRYEYETKYGIKDSENVHLQHSFAAKKGRKPNINWREGEETLYRKVDVTELQKKNAPKKTPLQQNAENKGLKIPAITEEDKKNFNRSQGLQKTAEQQKKEEQQFEADKKAYNKKFDDEKQLRLRAEKMVEDSKKEESKKAKTAEKEKVEKRPAYETGQYSAVVTERQTNPPKNVKSQLQINNERKAEERKKHLAEIPQLEKELNALLLKKEKEKKSAGSESRYLDISHEIDQIKALLKEPKDLAFRGLDNKNWRGKAMSQLGKKDVESTGSVNTSTTPIAEKKASPATTNAGDITIPMRPGVAPTTTVTSKARTGRRTPKKTTPAPAPVTTVPVATASTTLIDPLPDRSRNLSPDDLKVTSAPVSPTTATALNQEMFKTEDAKADAKSNITAFDILSLGQMMAGLVSDPGRRPEDKPDPLLLSRTAEAIANADKAEEQAKSGFSQSQRESLVQGIENNRRQAMASTVQVSAGSGSASTALRGLSQDKNRALINIAAEDENLKLQKAGRADSLNQHANAMVAGVDARGRQIFEDDKDAYWKEATATGELINSGLFNYFQSQERKTIEEMRKKRELQNQG